MMQSSFKQRVARAIVAGLTLVSGGALMQYGCYDPGYYDSYGYDYYGYDYYYGGYGPIDHDDFIDYIRS